MDCDNRITGSGSCFLFLTLQKEAFQQQKTEIISRLHAVDCKKPCTKVFGTCPLMDLDAFVSCISIGSGEFSASCVDISGPRQRRCSLSLPARARQATSPRPCLGSGETQRNAPDSKRSAKDELLTAQEEDWQENQDSLYIAPTSPNIFDRVRVKHSRPSPLPYKAVARSVSFTIAKSWSARSMRHFHWARHTRKRSPRNTCLFFFRKLHRRVAALEYAIPMPP